MFWIFPAIGAHLMWALENVGSKYIVGNRIRNPYVFLVLFTLGSLLTVSWVLIIFGAQVSFPPWPILGWIFVAAVFYFFGGLPYIKSIELEEVTRVNILWNIIPVFTFVIGWFFIGDILTGKEIFALVILILAAVLASLKRLSGRFVFSKAFWLMIVACFSYSVNAVIIRHASQSAPFVSIFFWFTIANCLCASTLLLIKSFRKETWRIVRDAGAPLATTMLSLSFVGDAGIFLNQWALSLKQTALVFSMEGFQVIFVFILAILIARRNPKLLNESLDKKNILLKISALALMMGGIALLSYK